MVKKQRLHQSSTTPVYRRPRSTVYPVTMAPYDACTPTSFPHPVNLSHHISRSTRAREASQVKEFYKYFQIPGIAQLAGGLPNDHYFPYDTLEARVARPDRWQPTPARPVEPPRAACISSQDRDPPSSRLVVPKNSHVSNPLRMIDLKSALQYGQAQGYPPLYGFIRQFTREHLHPTIPYRGGPEVLLTCGSTDGFSKTLQALSNEWSAEHDPVGERPGLLCETYCYMNAIQTATPRGFNIAPVAMDEEGMLATGPGGLEEVLENWDFTKGRRPHLLYTVTIGQNPTSGTLSVARRTEIYALAVRYDVIIIEDDPYWYLQYPSSAPAGSTSPRPAKSSGFEFLDSLIPSYLSIDYQGRVVRLDTFSKTAAPGCRLGWITAQPALIERLLRITETSTQQPSGFVQSMIAELIMGPQGSSDPGRGGAVDGSGWNVDGWVRWLEGLRGNYERRMQAMCDALDQGREVVKAGRRCSLARVAEDDEWAVVEKKQIYSFVRPLGGMFVWLRFDFDSHPLAKQVAAPRLARALWVFWTRKPYLCLVAPGTLFAATEEIRDRDSYHYFRLCFAACPADEVKAVSSRCVDGAQAFWSIRKMGKIDELLEDDGVATEADRVADMTVLTGMC